MRKKGGAKTGRSRIIQIRVTPDMGRALERLAKYHETTLSSYIAESLKWSILHNKEEK